jgi:hypothetical protein
MAEFAIGYQAPPVAQKALNFVFVGLVPQHRRRRCFEFHTLPRYLNRLNILR